MEGMKKILTGTKGILVFNLEEAIDKQDKVVLIVYVLNCVMQKVLENQNNANKNKIILR